MMRKLITILLTLLILLPSITIITSGEKNQDDENSGLRDSPWPIPQHDVRRTGKSPYGKEGCTGMLKWKTPLTNWATSDPVIDKDGTIYVGAWGGLYAIYPNGTVKWKMEIGCDGTSIGRDGTLYVVWSCYLRAISPDGEIKWTVRMGSDKMYGSPIIDKDGIIYVGTTSWRVAKFAAVYPNGTIKWIINASYTNGDFSPPAIYGDTVYVKEAYHDSWKCYLCAIYRDNGTVKWKKYIGYARTAVAPPSIAEDGTIYAVARGTLAAFYPNGTLKWKRDLDYSSYSAPAIDDDGNIYVATYGNDESSWSGSYIYAFDSNGTLLWKHHCYGTYGSPVIDKNGIIYGAGTHGLYAFNPDGTLRWVYKLGGKLWFTPAIGEDGTIYATGGSLYAIEPRDAADLRVSGVYYGPTFECIKIRVKNVGCEPAYNVTCEAKILVYPWKGNAETKTYTAEVPVIDVGQEVEVRIGKICLSPLKYIPFHVILGPEIHLLKVEAENANHDLLWEGGHFMQMSILGPLVCLGGLYYWFLDVMGSPRVEGFAGWATMDP
ncbi:MAG: PQQ-like beta-propeller repeat protein [Thermoplasmata archaeon]|nr:PQQ-like beta-propeller repeat protein [Thermoplasmata archaeon]